MGTTIWCWAFVRSGKKRIAIGNESKRSPQDQGPYSLPWKTFFGVFGFVPENGKNLRVDIDAQEENT